MLFNLISEDIKYIKILYKDNDGKACSIKSCINKINDTSIIATYKYDEKISIEAPQKIVLSIICSDGLYRTQTLLKSVHDKYPYMILNMEIPKNIDFQQNREYFRVPVKFDCVYSVKVENNFEDYYVETIDLSASGISIFMKTLNITEGESFIKLNIDGNSIKIRVEYVRSEKLENGYQVAFIYKDIKESSRDIIAKACIQKQLSDKRNFIKNKGLF